MKKRRYPNKLANKDFVFSEEYKKILASKQDAGGDDFRRIGAWRWEGIYDNRGLVASHVFDPNQVGIDFGGHSGPIGGYTKIIDIVLDNSLDDLEPCSLDYIFTSHTLEHIWRIRPILEKLYEKLRYGGKLIVLLPSFKKEVWRAYRASDHVHTMMLAGDVLNHYEVPEDALYKESLIEIDTELEKVGFKIIIRKHVRTWCIFIYGEK